MALPTTDEDALSGMASAPPSLHHESAGKGFFSVDTRCVHSLLAPLQDARCFAQVLSAALSAGVLVGGSLVKLPQLLKITRARGVEGLSELAVFVEALSASVFVSYNVLERHPFASWGEMLFVSAQNLCILMLFWKYRLPRNCVSEATKEKLDTARQASSEQGRSVPFLSRFSTFSSRERLLCRALLMVLFTTLSYARLVAERQSAFPRTLSGILGVAPFPLRTGRQSRNLCPSHPGSEGRMQEDDLRHAVWTLLLSGSWGRGTTCRRTEAYS